MTRPPALPGRGWPRWVALADGWLASPLLQFGSALGAAVLLGFISAVHLHGSWQIQGLTQGFGLLLVTKLLDWGLWAFILPLIVAVDRRAAGSGHPIGHRLLVHLAMALAWFAVHNAAMTVASRVADPLAPAVYGEAYLMRAQFKWPVHFVTYLFLIALLLLVRSSVRTGKLQEGLAEAQLLNLRTQLQPHFLFNALHTVGALIRRDDREGAIDTLVSLSDLLRRSLSHAADDEVTLREEIDFLHVYMQVQRARFGSRLRTTVDVAPDMWEERVPFLLLQPLVENAIHHGVESGVGEGEVGVRARREDGLLHILVEDRGPGFDEEDIGAGVGIPNLRRRLAALYGERARLVVEDRAEGGASVSVVVPLDSHRR